MRVLVLSNYAIVRTALRHMLSSSAETEVIGEAEVSENVSEIINKLRPDVVLIETVEAEDDVLAKAVERISLAGKVNLVVLAGHGDPGAIRAMLRAGVTGYVLKQSTAADLLAALRSAASGRRFLDSSLIEAITSEELSRPEPSPTDMLSSRQSEVLKFIVQGYTSGEIARKLSVSVKTVETYRSRIYDKLKVRSRAGLVQYAITAGLISVHDWLKR
jgi:DNA-binding NarL/FixJ family response regulator